MKRLERDETTNSDTLDALPAQFESMRIAAGPPPDPRLDREDRLTLFWRVFGGTILSICALAAVTVYNNLSSGISELRTELTRTNNELRSEIARGNEARGDLTRKDEFNSRLTTVWDGIKTMQAQGVAQSAAASAQRGEFDGLKDRLARLTADLEASRKDGVTSADGLKRDLAALDTLKEKVLAFGTELKASRDELMRIRVEVDRNQAYDNERKNSRDRQFALFDETVKELLKAVQDCREKIARLEGSAAPKPAKPKE